jgi:hypothetical protein
LLSIHHQTRESDTDCCFACDKPLKDTATRGLLVTCADEQTVFVGAECFRHIKAGREAGWQPKKGGPRLYMLQYKPKSI